jgi:hypothetical protein
VTCVLRLSRDDEPEAIAIKVAMDFEINNVASRKIYLQTMKVMTFPNN